MIDVHRYGLHREENLVFLHEKGRPGRCLNPGLGQLKSPFQVKIGHWIECPHDFEDPIEETALDHPLVRAMGPDQDGGLYHLPLSAEPWLWQLAQMTSVRIIELWFALGYQRMRAVTPKLITTNLAPLVILDWTARDFNQMERLAALPRTRNLILCGPIALPGSTRLSPQGLDLDHDWPAEGRRQLHQLIRRTS